MSGTEKKTESAYKGQKPTYDKSNEARHTPGHPDYAGPRKTEAPDDAERVYNDGAISGDDSGKTWYARADDGKTVYRYQAGSGGTNLHFNGSTATGLRKEDIPIWVKRKLDVKP
jgi:hypothetical protein